MNKNFKFVHISIENPMLDCQCSSLDFSFYKNSTPCGSSPKPNQKSANKQGDTDCDVCGFYQTDYEKKTRHGS